MNIVISFCPPTRLYNQRMEAVAWPKPEEKSLQREDDRRFSFCLLT